MYCGQSGYFLNKPRKHYDCENFLRDILIDFISKIQRSIADRAVGTRDCFVSTVCCPESLPLVSVSPTVRTTVWDKPSVLCNEFMNPSEPRNSLK